MNVRQLAEQLIAALAALPDPLTFCPDPTDSACNGCEVNGDAVALVASVLERPGILHRTFKGGEPSPALLEAFAILAGATLKQPTIAHLRALADYFGQEE